MAVTKVGRTKTTGSSARPDPIDLLNIDAHLSEEEGGVREKVRSFVQERIKPNIEGWYDEAIFPKEIVPEFAERGRVLIGLHGARGRGLRPEDLRQRTGLTRHERHPQVRVRGPETEVAATDGERRDYRLFRPHRADRRLRSGEHEDLRQEGRLRLGLERGEALDRACHHRRRRRRLGAYR